MAEQYSGDDNEMEYGNPAKNRYAAYGVHLFTASGIVFAVLAAAEIASTVPDPRVVFMWLGIQVLIDAADGPLARKFHVKRYAPHVDGRKMDDIIDYITYTFLPLFLVWRMEWLPWPALIWLIPALVTSLFGFCNLGAKDETGGFFLGFPSYWNIVAFYLGLWYPLVGPWPGAVLVLVLSVLTVAPIRFLYPNLAPEPWKMPMLIGAGLWALLISWMIVYYDVVPPWITVVSLIYPVGYTILSIYLDYHSRRIGT